MRVIYENIEYYGRIIKLEPTAVHIKFKREFVEAYESDPLEIEFQFNRLLFVRQHFAVDHVSSTIGAHFINPIEVQEKELQLDVDIVDKHNAKLNGEDLKWYNTNLNEYQRQAVVNVMQGRARPMPYIIFGPPGEFSLLYRYYNIFRK